MINNSYINFFHYIKQLRSDFDNILNEIDLMEEEYKNIFKKNQNLYEEKYKNLTNEIEIIRLDRDDTKNKLEKAIKEKSNLKQECYALKEKNTHLEEVNEKISNKSNIYKLEDTIKEVI